MKCLIFPARGFTVIEIVVAIAIVGILSALAISRLTGSDTYDPAIARDQIISLSRSAQQKAIGRSGVELTIQPGSESLAITLIDDVSQVQTSLVDLQSVTLAAGINQTASCADNTGLTALAPAALVLSFDRLGDLQQANVGSDITVTGSVRLCIDSNPAMSVCWSSAGFAYPGDCVE
ncbi:type II secretion system protein [Gammaproteobacteria bacterium LSUCC0112]|nr:type II secretion system protein [Gammaproteobacteria bacterium LSUCC0112]